MSTIRVLVNSFDWFLSEVARVDRRLSVPRNTPTRALTRLAVPEIHNQHRITLVDTPWRNTLSLPPTASCTDQGETAEPPKGNSALLPCALSPRTGVELPRLSLSR